jgi:predicted naringenin-chalcone synthase
VKKIVQNRRFISESDKILMINFKSYEVLRLYGNKRNCTYVFERVLWTKPTAGEKIATSFGPGFTAQNEY